MLGVIKSKLENGLSVQLTGTIDERVVFSDLIGDPGKELHLKCNDVLRINSIGVKSWQEFFEGLRKRGVKLKFLEISAALVEQANFLRGFIRSEELESICVSFYCGECRSDTVRILSISELRNEDLNALQTQCPTCQATIEFDELPDAYFSFLKA